MRRDLLLCLVILTFLFFGCSNVQVGFGVSINVNHIKTTDQYIEFQITDEKANPLSNVTLQVQINDDILCVTTDEHGYVRIYVDFSAVHSIVVRYLLFEINMTINF